MPLPKISFDGIEEILSHLEIDSDEKTTLNTDEIENICRYLENPTRYGIWTFEAHWNGNSGISYYLNTESTINEEEIDKEKALDRINNRITFQFGLFTYIYLKENKGSLKSFNMLPSGDRIIFNSLDIEKLKSNYSEAYEFFVDNIYYDGLNTIVNLNSAFRIKKGLLILVDSPVDNDNDKIKFLSLDKDVLYTVNEFLEAIGKVSNPTIKPIFSPEEKVFEPYFSLLTLSYPYFVDNENIMRLFQKSIDEYSNREYEYCVRTIGLIAEDYLTQIYETFYRDVCPRKLTLGQIYDKINDSIAEIFPKKVYPDPNITPLFDKTNELLDNLDDNSNDLNIEETLKIIRQILNYIQSDKKHTKHLVSLQKNDNEKRSVFPKYLRENINELIKYRNATAHNSRIPIGNYESLRTVYCCISLLMWWIAEQNQINWEATKEDILKEAISRNTDITDLT